MFLDKDHLNLLDWPMVIDVLLSYAHFSQTKSTLSEPPLFQEPENLRHHYHELKKFLATNDREQLEKTHKGLSYLNADHTIANALVYAKKSGVLDVHNLHEIALLIELALGLNILSNKEYREVYHSFVSEIRKIITPNGQIDFMAHPELAGIQKDIFSLEINIRQQIDSLKFDNHYKNSFQFLGSDTYNDYYVVAINADFYQKSHGAILNSSESRKTFYVEPFAIKELNKKRLELLSEQKEMLYKIYKRLSSFLSLHSDHVIELLEAVYDLDLMCAKALYHENLSLCIPEIVESEEEFVLHGFFHPLIKNSILNDFDGQHKRGLILSGPNTGGKTIALKSIALSHLLMHIGVGVNAKMARLYPYQNIYYFSHDQQNIQEGLSSFSAECKQYMNLMRNFKEKSLVFFDEIFNSTSSEEASSLALALFKSLLKFSQTKIFVTTHHYMLKTQGHISEDFLSAHVLLDDQSLLPTYKISYGNPGASHAITIFKKLTQNDDVFSEILNDAFSFLSQKEIKFEQLLQDLNSRKVQLDKSLQENEQINKELKNMKQASLSLLNMEKKKEIQDFNKKLEEIIEEAKNRVNLSDLSIKKINKIEQESRLKMPIVEDEEISTKKEKVFRAQVFQVEVGKSYYSSDVGKNIIVKSIDQKNKTALVSHRNFTLNVNIKNLYKADKEKDTFSFNIKNTIIPQFSLDARGMQLDEFTTHFEQSLSNLLMGEIPYLEVIHGHGTGVLKNYVRSYLRSNKDKFIWKIPDHSSDGSTTISLK